MKTFEEWCQDREIVLNELSPKFLTMAYKIWGEDCFVEGQRHEAENAVLRERLGKAIILPCKLGDKLYFVNKYLATPKIQEHYITAIEIFPSYVKLYVEDGGYFILDGDNVYFNPEAAEARLAELKGEEK